uniref:Uncharacterized protein n=1 Tax=Meloidogyne enterolobii TaxID=390850 RepID=A0A6V7V414_MELEN|nr:unnamed protein product [Meloidogyne enterolobii]
MVVLVSKQLRLFPHRFNGDASSFQRLDFLIVYSMVRLIVDGGFAISDRSLKTGKKGSLKGGKQVNYLFFVSFF